MTRPPTVHELAVLLQTDPDAAIRACEEAEKSGRLSARDAGKLLCYATWSVLAQGVVDTFASLVSDPATRSMITADIRDCLEDCREVGCTLEGWRTALQPGPSHEVFHRQTQFTRILARAHEESNQGVLTPETLETLITPFVKSRYKNMTFHSRRLNGRITLGLGTWSEVAPSYFDAIIHIGRADDSSPIQLWNMSRTNPSLLRVFASLHLQQSEGFGSWDTECWYNPRSPVGKHIRFQNPGRTDLRFDAHPLAWEGMFTRQLLKGPQRDRRLGCPAGHIASPDTSTVEFGTAIDKLTAMAADLAHEAGVFEMLAHRPVEHSRSRRLDIAQQFRKR